MSEPSITIPDVIPTVTIVETTTTSHDVLGTPEETVNKMVALDWVVEEETSMYTTMSHPLIPGTKRYIKKF
jgi:hypothetical protein